jgi:hypothetical protein
MGRLKEGVSLQQATAEMQAIIQQLAEESPSYAGSDSQNTIPISRWKHHFESL